MEMDLFSGGNPDSIQAVYRNPDQGSCTHYCQ